VRQPARRRPQVSGHPTPDILRPVPPFRPGHPHFVGIHPDIVRQADMLLTFPSHPA
jgi:hypothetical protein